MQKDIRAAVMLSTLSAVTIGALAQTAVVDYPNGYRAWTHVKSMVIHEGHALYDSFGGLHHIYANPAALEGYRSGHFPDGAVIVFDLLAVSTDGNATTEASRKILGVMQKDRQRFAETGGWGFEGFAAGSRDQRVVGDDAATACFACHLSQQSSDYVFSRFRD